MKKPKQAKPQRAPQLGRAVLPQGKPASKHTQKPHHHPRPHHAQQQARSRFTAAGARHLAAAAKARAKNAKVKKPAKRRGFTVGDAACCAAEALAASLRLTGRPVDEWDVLGLYWHTARSADAGAPILATLEAAGEHGLAGVYPVSFQAVDLDDPAAVILGVDLPGAHTVCDDGTCWWSWGQRWAPGAFPDAVVEEAWAVMWP